MFGPLPSDPELLRKTLSPLLDDFTHWFEGTQTLLGSGRLAFMAVEAQESLLDRVQVALREVNVSRSLLSVTDGQAGVEMAVLMGWHKLVAECWSISIKNRSANS
jgi:hypothetical protein